MCMELLPVSIQATDAAEVTTPKISTEGDVWDGSITQPTTLVQKDGVYYYEITKCSELAYVAQTGEEWLSRNYLLANNLILNNSRLEWNENYTLLNDTEKLHEWLPIGDGSNSFSGILDGNGYCVSGVLINSGTRTSRCGLLGFLGGGGCVRNLSVLNSYIRGTSDEIGGIVGFGYGLIYNCSFAGVVIGGCDVGGIVGNVLLYRVEKCSNDGIVISYNGENVGGIAGYANAANISSCSNTGVVIGKNNVGGIVGQGQSVECCSNSGAVRGEDNVGGIAGENYSTIINTYNNATIIGNNNIGGICGKERNSSLRLANCYSIGNVLGKTETSGAVIGSDGALFGKGTFERCFYLKDDKVNVSIYGCGNVFQTGTNEPEGFFSKNNIELRTLLTFTDWDFEDIWAISADKNGGYPYLKWQEGMLSDIPVNSVQISETALFLVEGDYAYLTATASPTNASNKSITWSSSVDEVATVNSAGKVTAISAGTATITVTTEDGGYTATCTVTVTERLAEEYRINSITARDSDGAVLSVIPDEEFLATVSITNLASEGNTLVFLASYTDEGQYQGMMWVSIEDLSVGSTCKVTLPVDNTVGKIANLKAFTVASFSNLTPLGDVVSFLSQ